MKQACKKMRSLMTTSRLEVFKPYNQEFNKLKIKGCPVKMWKLVLKVFGGKH